MNTLNFEQVNYDTLSDIKPILTNFVFADLHWHKDIEIVFVYQGELNLSLRGEQLALRQGDIKIINSSLIHSVNSNRTNTENIVFLLQIGEQFMRGLHLNIEAVRYDQPTEDSQALEKIRRYLLRIIREIKERKPSYELAVHSYCCSIIAVLSRYLTIPEDEKTVEQRLSDETNLLRLKRIFAYVQDHYHENPSLSDIANMEHISQFYLSRIFTKSVGINYTQYLNKIRVDMVRRDLSETNESVTDILLRHGFTNFKTFNRIFKKIVGCSPTEYRKSSADMINVGKLDVPEADSRFGSYIFLKPDIEIPYNSYQKQEAVTERFHARTEEKLIKVDINGQSKLFDRYYKLMTAAARASDLLRADVREHLRVAQNELGFQYIRFHGIFNDEMCVLDPQGNGTLYNFMYIDYVFDFLMEIGLRPFVEFSFMPAAIASGQKTVFFYKGNVTPPKHIQLWENLISAFMRHIIARYSIEEVQNWYFEVWNEPNLTSYWGGSFEDYMELYRVSAAEVKKADAQCRVGGPSLNSFQYNDAKQYLVKFLQCCHKENLPVDFVSGHPYPAFYFSINGEWKEELRGPDQTKEDMIWIRDTVQASGYPNAEIHLNEWNTSSLDRDLIHDTAFMAVFVLHNIIHCSGLVDSLTFWALTDLFEENFASIHEFHGGFGLFNRNGLKKPAYFAFQYLNRLSDKVLCRGMDYIVTKGIGSIQILAWNYCHYKKQYTQGDRSEVTFYNRYEAFEITEPVSFRFQIPSGNGDYFIEKAEFNREHGSVFDIWLENGAIDYMLPGQLQLIREQNHLSRGVTVYNCVNNTIEISAEIEPFGFTFFEIKQTGQ